MNFNTDVTRAKIGDVITSAQEALAALPASVAETFTVRAGDSFTTALQQELPIVVEAGAQIPGSYTIPSNRTILFGRGAGVRATTGPALRIAPGTKTVALGGGEHYSQSSEAILQIGENTSRQASLADQPEGIDIVALSFPTHRGKRAIAVHGYRVKITRVKVADCWSAQDKDSQAIYGGNARGEIDIEDCELEAGSMQILFGGDSVKTPGLHPTGIRIRRNKLTRPLAWMTDADSTKRRLKNSFELKDAIDVEFTDNLVDGLWSDPRVTQGCYAVVLTPALDGNKTDPPALSGVVGNVLIAGNTFKNIGAGVNVIGRHYQAITDPALYGVKIQRNRFRISRAKFGGFGQFLKIGGEPQDLEVSDNVILQDGSSHIVTYKGDVLDPVTGISRPGGPIGALTYQGNTAELGKYGFNIDGDDNALMDKIALNITAPMFAGNTYKGVARKGVYGGVYLEDAAFEMLQVVQDLRLSA